MSVAALMPSFGIMAEEAKEREMWLGLFREEREASEAMREACHALEEAEWAAREKFPRQEIELHKLWYGAGGGKPLGWHWGKATLLDRRNLPHRLNQEEIQRWYDRDYTKFRLTPAQIGEGEQYLSNSVAQLETWKAECDRVKAEHHVPDLAELSKATDARWRAAERAIVDTPATSMIGVAIKLAFWIASGDGQNVFEQPESESGDTLAVLSAWKAAVTLAGLPDEFGAEEHKARLLARAKETSWSGGDDSYAADLDPRFDEARELIKQIEQHDEYVIYDNGSVFFGNPRKGVSEETCILWQQLRAKDRATLIEYLKLTGRTEVPAHCYE
jgi:hypothetical protein